MYLTALAGLKIPHVTSRWNSTSESAAAKEVSERLMQVFFAHHAGLQEAISGDQTNPQQMVTTFSDRTKPAGGRRRECIQLVQMFPNRSELLVKLLEARAAVQPESLQFEGKLGGMYLGESRSPESEQVAQWTWTSPPMLPTQEVGLVKYDGRWKINTLIDPALKPWPITEPADDEALRDAP